MTILAAVLAAALLLEPAHGRPHGRKPEKPTAKSAVANKASGGRGVLVLQVGSDWCVSGEAVRKAFESREFRRAVGSKYVLAVYDEMESPTPAAKAANAEIGGLLIRTKRFPAMTCYASGRDGLHFFAQIENIPQGVDGERLAAAVAKVAAKKDQAVKLFAKAKSAMNQESAADAYGEAFDLLASMAGQFHFGSLVKGPWAWSAEWDALCELDAGDRFGWRRHFEMDDAETVRMVESVTNARRTGHAGKSAQQIVDEIKKIPQTHFSANQKQCVKVMEYALTYSGVSTPLSDDQRRLMEEAFALGRDTFWGQYAMGRLMLDGKDIESKGLPKAKTRERPAPDPSKDPPSFPMEVVRKAITPILPNAELSEAQKLAVARYAVLRLIGEDAWRDVASRPGAASFMKAFFGDRFWLEDFAWSGSFPRDSRGANGRSNCDPGAAGGAFRALEEIVFQDGGRWVPLAGGKYEDNEGRRFMTALAISYPDRGVEWLADVLDAYRASAKAGRLHKSAYSQPVWLWRFAVQQGLGANYMDGNSAAQHRQLDRFLNQPTGNGGGDTTGVIPYRLENCFGDSIWGSGGAYYKAWRKAGEWPMSRYVPLVGGVCAQISTYGSAVANAHGLPSSTVDEPKHLSYTRRLLDGRWCLNYTVTGHSMTRLAFWNRRPWQYTAALEQTFSGDRESRLAADRLLELAHVADERGAKLDTVEAYYRRACNLWPQHYRAWYEYGDWVARSGVSLDTMRTWLKGCARGMKTGSRPLWDFLTPFFARAAKEKGAAGLAEELVHFAPLLRQGEQSFQQEADFDMALGEWCEALGGDARLAGDVLKAMLSAQWGTRNCFAQTLSWGGDFFSKHGSMDDFVKCIEESVPDGAMSKGKKRIDLGPTILSASNNDNLEAFRQLSKIQKRIAPDKAKPKHYPGRDFGGSLVSPDGLFRMSSVENRDNLAILGRIIDDSSCIGSLHTAREKNEWAQVMMEGPTAVTGIVLSFSNAGFPNKWKYPLEVSVSDDGKSWRSVCTVGKDSGNVRAMNGEEVGIDLRSRSPHARFVRVSRTTDSMNEALSVGKFLVYGAKLY